jgi:hypothetical protein
MVEPSTTIGPMTTGAQQQPHSGPGPPSLEAVEASKNESFSWLVALAWPPPTLILTLPFRTWISNSIAIGLLLFLDIAFP